MKSETLSKKLNIGCGADAKEGWVNLDWVEQPGVDVVHDITKLPLPFTDETFDEILCQDILEHVDYMPVLKDIHRITKTGGKVRIRVPHYTSRNSFTDPTHIKRHSVSTFDYFCRKESRGWADLNLGYAFDHWEKRYLNFDKTSSRLLFYNRLIEWWFNRTPRQQVFYEMTGLCYMFPAADIRITLVK
jgi:SAM-dependent methyltransferase